MPRLRKGKRSPKREQESPVECPRTSGDWDAAVPRSLKLTADARLTEEHPKRFSHVHLIYLQPAYQFDQQIDG